MKLGVFNKVLPEHHRKNTSSQILSCEFCETFKNSFFTEQPRVTVSKSVLPSSDFSQSDL